MDNMAYLQQISAPTPEQKASPLKSLMNSRLLKILLGLAGLAILIIIFGSIFRSGQSSHGEFPLAQQVQFRNENLAKTITSYNSKLKSSSLRSSGQSLSTVLNETNSNLKSIIKQDFSTSDSSTTSTIKESEANYIANTNATLQNALLNAALDRTYARQMALEISLLSSLESELLTKTSNSNLRSTLEKSLSNLSALHDNFDNFSDSNL